MTKISQLSSIGDSLAIGDQFLIRDIDDVGSPNKSVTVSGITRALDLGTAAAPAIAFASDKNTGIYSPGADQVAVATNGTGRVFVNASGNVGVGLSNPSYPLEVAAPTDSTINITGGTSNLCRLFFSDTALARGFLNYDHADDSLRIGTAASERLRITSAGTVGIGTSSPANRITAAGAEASVGIFNTTAGSTVSPSFCKLNFYGYLEESIWNVASISAGNSALNTYGGTLRFATNTEAGTHATALTIDNQQRVGIGTTSPLTKLEVRSGVITAGSVDAPNGAEILRGYYGSNGALVVIGSEYSSGGTVIGSSVKPSTSASDAFLSSASGALPRGAYTIAGNIHKWYIGGIQTVAENSSVTMSEAMRIDASGRVGIGTTLAGNANNRLLVRSDSASAITNVLLLNNGLSDNNAGQGVRINLSGVSEASSNIRYAYIEAANQTSSNDHYLAFGTNPVGATPQERARIDSSGRLLVGTSSDSGGALLQVNGDRIRVGTAKTPATSGATGTTGEIAWDANYIYVCTATNTWKRSAIATW